LITDDLNRSGPDMLCDIYIYKAFLEKSGGWNRLEDLKVDGIVVLKWNFKKHYGGGTCNGLLSQGHDMRLALVNAVMNLRVP